jgi:hypothetical protein
VDGVGHALWNCGDCLSGSWSWSPNQAGELHSSRPFPSISDFATMVTADQLTEDRNYPINTISKAWSRDKSERLRYAAMTMVAIMLPSSLWSYG